MLNSTKVCAKTQRKEKKIYKFEMSIQIMMHNTQVCTFMVIFNNVVEQNDGSKKIQI